MAQLASYNGSILPKELTKARKNTSTKAYYRLQALKACISRVIFDLVPAITRACAEIQVLGYENKGYGRSPLNASQLTHILSMARNSNILAKQIQDSNL